MTTNLTPSQRKEIARRLSPGGREDFELLLAEGEFEGFDHSETADRFLGCADWVGYVPGIGRACWVSNGDPMWFDASSLDDAVGQVRSDAELVS